MNQRAFNQNTYDFEESSQLVQFKGVPDACPSCHRGQAFDNPFHIRFARDKVACFGFFQCIFSDCRIPFIGNYVRHRSNRALYYLFSGTQVPSYTKPLDEIPEIIDEISPNYRQIYAQAYQAETEGLELIAGCGYRKALEFLVKDCSIRILLDGTKKSEITDEQKEAIQNIKSAQLGVVINTHLKMPKVQSLAARATWLGNDETHYERRIENGDVQIMKSLMRLVIHFIEAEEEAKKLEAEIQPAD